MTCAILLVSGLALGDSDEVVTLHDGSRFRGTLVELVPHDHVTLKLATGEVRRFDWANVEKTEEVGASAPPSAPVQPQGVTVNVAAPSTRTVVLQRRTGSMTVPGRGEAPIWADACTAPCDVAVPSGIYRLAGPGVAPTGAFDLPDHGRVRVDGTLGSAGGRVAGFVLATIGGALLITGVVWGVLGIAFATSPINKATSDFAVGYGVVGGVSGGVGLLCLIPGIILLVNNSSHAAVVQLARLTTTGLRF